MAFRKISTSNLKSTETSFDDSLIILNKQGVVRDIGFLGVRGVNQYAGLVRDSNTSEFMLIDSITFSDATINDVNALDASIVKGNLTLGTLNVDSIVGVTIPTDVSQLTDTTNLLPHPTQSSYSTVVGHNIADETDTSSIVLNPGDAVTPATFRGDVINNSGTVIVDVSSTSVTFNGGLMGNVYGDVYTPDGSQKVLESGTNNTDSSLTVTTASATTLNATTTNISGNATFTGDSADFTGTQTIGNWNGAVYDRTGATLIIEDNASPTPIVHANLDGNITSAGTSVFTGTLDLTSATVTGLSDIDLSAVNQSIVPVTASTYNLGSVANPWKDLYLDGNTMFLGDTKLSRNSSGDIEIKDRATNQAKKIKVSEIELDDISVDSTYLTVMKKASNGKIKQFKKHRTTGVVTEIVDNTVLDTVLASEVSSLQTLITSAKTEAAADATTKTNAAVVTANTSATTKANSAQSAAIAAAESKDVARATLSAADATTKANAARDAAISSAESKDILRATAASADAAAKVSALQLTASTDATTKANNAKSQAITAAATDATTKANAAQSAAATDATTKSDNAKSQAITAAATDATTKANNAKSQAIVAAAADATTKANNAKSQAISTAASDATTKANAAQAGAIAAVTNGAGAAFDTLVEIQNAMATDSELSSAISSVTSSAAATASADATTKANAALASALAADQTPSELLSSIKTVDGSGSGLDADLLDGQQGSYYAPKSTPTFTGTITNAGTISTAGASHTFNTQYGNIQLGPMNSSWAHIYTNIAQGFYFNKQLAVNGSMVWNAGNDGSGSGLDADLLDGQQGSYYYPASNPNGYTNDQTAAEILTKIKTVDGSGSGLDADTVDGYNSNRFTRRTGKATATVGPGWVTVASTTSGRNHGEVIVTDSDSGDHAYIRMDWMRSYQDSNFTVLNCGGHANRITGARTLYQTSDTTYGTKYLQVYVTVSSSYEVNIYENGDIDDFGGLSVVTPVVQNSITGYALHGAELTGLDTYGFATEEGIRAGGSIYSGGSITAAGDVTAYSDERLKSEIVTIPNALDTVSKLRGVNYIKDDKASTGVIAQEVEAVIPELVHTANDEMGTKSVAYGNMMGVMIEAIKELTLMVESQAAEIAKLKIK